MAIPTWRKVLLIPDPMPAFCGGTTPIAVWAIPGFTMPIPAPANRNPARSVVQSSPSTTPCISSRAIPTRVRPTPSNARMGTRAESLPATGETKNDRTVSGRKMTPALRGEWPRTSWT